MPFQVVVGFSGHASSQRAKRKATPAKGWPEPCWRSLKLNEASGCMACQTSQAASRSCSVGPSSLTPQTSTLPVSSRGAALIICISTQRQGREPGPAQCANLTELLSKMLKDCTDIHAPFEISGKSQCDHTSIQCQEGGNQFDVIIHLLIIGGMFATLWSSNLWRC